MRKRFLEILLCILMIFSIVHVVSANSDLSEFQTYALENWIKPIRVNYLSIPGTGRAFGASRSNGRKHAAIDYYVRNGNGTPVYAMTSGTVIECSPNFYAGTQAIGVQNDDGSVLRYGEISTSLRVGSRISQGEQIGAIKANTSSGGTMLHLELYKGTASGSLSNTSNKTYDYVSGNFQRRRDLLNPEFLLRLSDNPAIPNPPDTNRTRVCLEAPTERSFTAYDDIEICGWMISDHDITAVTCTVNGEKIYPSVLDDRSDVTKAFPGYNYGGKGFYCVIPKSSLHYDKTNEIVIRALTLNNTVIIAEVAKLNVEFGWLPFRAKIEEPAETSFTTSEDISMYGWAIYESPFSAITYVVNGEVIRQCEMYDRNDVKDAFPGYKNGKEGFSATIPKEYLKEGNNEIIVRALLRDNTVLAGEVGRFNVNYVKIPDNTPPTIENVHVTDLSKSGYTLHCTVNDDIKLKSTRLYVWTEKDDQDDIKWFDSTEEGEISFRVNTSDHNNEEGNYKNHIYVYDAADNRSIATITVDIPYGKLLATPTPKPTATPTLKPTPSPTLKPTATPTLKPTPSPTLKPTATPTLKPTPSPTPKPTATPTLKPTSTPTLKPTATPTLKPTLTPTLKPTATPTLKPTLTPTPKPTATPTLKPTLTPTSKPTVKPTPKPTTKPTSTPAPSSKPELNNRTEFVRLGNTVIARLVFENNIPSSSSNIHLIAAYKKNGYLQRAEMHPITDMTSSFIIPEEFNDCEIYIYLWDKNMEPLMQAQKLE